jgi:uncharacterized ParB-like nuclease family protein
MKKINIASIRIDGGTQSRVSINTDTVAEYAEAVTAGTEFPPVIVFNDGSDHWLADGFHRYHAHQQAGKVSIAADVREGTVRDAILFSLGANGTHGLRRTNADKRKAVLTVLADAEWATWSDRKIAELCGVGHPFVATLRRPEAAERQEQNRKDSAAKKAAALESDSTRDQPKPTANVESDSSPKPKKREIEPEKPSVGHADELAEAQHTIADLAQENEQLRDRLAVESMDGTEAAKTEAAETIRELRAQVKALEAELQAVKSSRDTYMREATEAKKDAIRWRKRAEKADKAGAAA